MGEFTLLDKKTYYEAAIFKTEWYKHRDREIYQWSKLEFSNTFIYI